MSFYSQPLRISTVPGDPGHALLQEWANDGWHVSVSVDNVFPRRLIMADEGEGVAIIIELDEEGEPVMVNGACKTRLIRGEVRIWGKLPNDDRTIQ